MCIPWHAKMITLSRNLNFWFEDSSSTIQIKQVRVFPTISASLGQIYSSERPNLILNFETLYINSNELLEVLRVF